VKPEDPEVARSARAGAEARRAMVARIVAAGLVSDPRVVEALATVPRHLFVPEALVAEAYGDHALPIGAGQTITQAANVGRAAELAAIPRGGRVLEVGTGSGYQAAVLARLAGQVFSLERIPELAAEARRVLASLGVRNVSVKVFDGTYGWREHAPYDAIVVAAGGPRVPQALLDQLTPQGRLVIPVGSRGGQILELWQRAEGDVRCEAIIPVAFVPLVGKFGWREER